MKILTLVSILETAAILLLLYEAYAPGTVAGLVPWRSREQLPAPATESSNDTITRREIRYIVRDELARYRETAPPPITVAEKETAPGRPDQSLPKP